MTTAWIDLRDCAPERVDGLIAAAIENNIESVVLGEDGAAQAGDRRQGIKWVSMESDANGHDDAGSDRDIRIFPHKSNGLDLAASALQGSHRSGLLIEVRDKHTLDEACAAVRAGMLTTVKFTDPTKIPLEIVLAAAANRNAKVMTFVSNVEDAKIVMSVLESGPDGVIMTPQSPAEIAELGRLCAPRRGQIDLKPYEVVSVTNAGTGDRVCVDTCSDFAPDEGILVGSFGGGFILCCSETHPLPYMKTRPFRVNAGSLNSYVLTAGDQTNYLSELQQGEPVLGVTVDGRTRDLVVGRAKIETRPLILVKARSEEGDEASIMLQNDWHVRVLGPEGEVLNVTELKPGSTVLGHAASRARHVGMPINEYCLEQ